VDASGHYAVTAAEDKTARIWDLSTGRLLRTLRPPSGPGNEGKLFAAAMTPDGKVVAAGGWSADNDVYLFDRATGSMIQRITGLPETITQLAFSPDGLMLLIGLWGRNGIRLFGTEAGWRTSHEIDSDPHYEGEVYGVQFAADGKRLASASSDGRVRVYDLNQRRLRLSRSARLSGGSQPFGVSYSPDGQLLAVSFSDSSAVMVLQATTLQLAYAPNVVGVANGSLNALAWSANGRELLAAGTWRRSDRTHGLRRWAEAGRGTASETSVASNSVVGLRALADGRIIYAAADPAWGWLTFATPASASTTASPANLALRSGLVDFRDGRGEFRVSHDGSSVAFALRDGSGAIQTMGFDVPKAEWTSPQSKWTAPSARGNAMVVADWFESLQPRINGRAIALTDNEVSMTAAVAPDDAGVALGTSFYLRFYRADGTMSWRVAAPGTTWQVNVSGDGRWVIAGFSDGTLRWYRTRDGAELLALLPHADRKRWVVWTPQGYYAASPGGEDLFGWQIDRGPSRAADFFPGSRFRATYFRPDVIASVPTTADIETALRLATQGTTTAATVTAPSPPLPVQPTPPTPPIALQIPPVVTVLAPRDGDSFSSPEITLSISIRAPASSPPMGLRARLDGSIFELPQAQASSWPAARNVVVTEDQAQELPETRYERRITLAPQDHELMLFAENRNGYSTPAVVRLKWAGAKDVAGKIPAVTGPVDTGTTTAAADLRPALYVLAMGVGKYQNRSIPQLDFPSKDASDFANVFRLQENRLYRKVEIKLLTDASAKRDDVLDGLEWIRRQMTSRDVGVVFMAGHGVNDSDGVYYYLPQDGDVDKLKRSAVIFTEIKNTLAALPGKALFFIDTCHSGNVLGTARRAIGNDLTSVVNELSSAENGVIVFAASTGRQFSLESREWGNGAFTLAVIEGMSGKADMGRTGRVTHKMLDLYISERVKALTRGSQSPVTIVPQGIPDFPVGFSH
jgi:WD40 repeat protein